MTSVPSPVPRLPSEALLPSALLADELAGGSGLRTARDWIIDVLAVLSSAAVGALFFWGNLDTRHDFPLWQRNLDWVLGLAAVLAVWWRRRWPVGVGIVTAAFTTVSAAASGASVIALFTVAVHRRWPQVALVGAVNVVAGTVYALYRPQDISFWWSSVINLLAPALVIAWGMFVRARRQLVWTLRERAERAEREQRMLAEQARVAERTRIAREMHDVLAHRISLLALHAGGLELRPDLPTEEVRRTAELLRSTAHHALEELRGVIGVLRDGDDANGSAPASPQPTLADLGRLIEESRRAGGRITFTLDVPPEAAVPAALGRDAYRIVQESLTNVAKHARGTATSVVVRGDPGGQLCIDVRNRLPLAGPARSMPGSGRGLLGLQERVALAGGTLTHGPTDGGEFAVAVRLTWAEA